MTPVVAQRSPTFPRPPAGKSLSAKNGILLKPIRRVRLYEDAVEQIQNLILMNQYRPGERLPSERSLAEQFHISRHSLREALRILDVMGLIEIRVGDGIYVKKADFLPYIESLNLSISSRLPLEREGFVKLWRVRRILEIGMVEMAARQATDSFLKSLRWCIGEMKKNIEDQEAFVSAGIRFHRLIAELAQNEILILIWDMLASLIRSSQSKIYGIPWSPRKALGAHRKIYLALKERDVRKSVEAMKEHMLDEERALLAALKKGGEIRNPKS